MSDGEPSRPAPWREVFRGPHAGLTVGLLLLEALVAVQTLVVITILPAVRADLGGVQLYGWALSASSLAAFAAIPIAGRAADRYGPRRPLALMLGVFVLGLAVSALAPSMLVVAIGRFLQGSGAGALYAVSLGAVAKTFPARLRPRVLALLASMWILPGLLGPPFGALVASTVGWRWAFVSPLPVLGLALWLVLPALRGVVPEEGEVVRLSPRWPLQLMVGAGLFLGGLAEPSLWSIPVVVAGLWVALPALGRIIPPGSFSARRGLPAAGAAAFLLSAAFFAVDGFVPLMLTGVRGASVAEASVVVTLATVAWSAGSWWQSRRAETLRPSTLVATGAAMIVAGTIAVASGLLAIPVAVPYAGWAIAGIGIGIAFPTIPLAVMSEAAEGSESGELSSTLLMDTLGVAIGAGLGGSSVALAHAAGAGLRVGLAGAFLLGLVATLLLLVVARRLPAGAVTPEA